MPKNFPSIGGHSWGGGSGGGRTGAGASSGQRQSISSGPQDRLLKTCLMIFSQPTVGGGAAVSDGDWGVGAVVQQTSYVKGANWQVWKEAVSGMAGSSSSEIRESVANGYEYIAFDGTTGKNHAACADVTFFGHAPARVYIEDCVRRSNNRMRPGLFFANFESVSHETEVNSWWTTLNAISLARLRNTGAVQTNVPPGNINAACVNADIFQTTTSPGPAPCGTQAANTSPHTWICDMAAATIQAYSDLWFSTLQTMILSRYGFGLIKYVIVDNVLTQTNWGTAVNVDAAITSTIYTNSWKTFWAHAAQFETATGAKIVGNCGIASTPYTNAQVPARYGEHFFHLNQDSQQSVPESLTNVRARLTAAAGQTVIMPNHQIKSVGATYTARSYGASHVDGWSGTDNGPGGSFGTWTDIRDIVYTTGQQEKFLAVAGRTHSTFPLFWSDKFKRPNG